MLYLVLNGSRIRMYKGRITAWGFDKKMKGNEVRAIVRMRRKRLAAGKASTFRVRGQVLDFDKVKSHLKRKGLALDDVPSESNSPIPDLECYTPEPQVQEPSCSATDNALTVWNGRHMFRIPSPRLVSSPDSLRIPEQLFGDIHTYFTESFASSRWVYQGGRRDLVDVTRSTPLQAKLRLEPHWSQIMRWTVLLFKAGGAANVVRAGQHLQRAFIQVEDVIKAEEPSLMFNLLELLDEFEAYYEKPEIVRILLKHIHSLASVFLGMKHPIASASRQLSFLDTWTNISEPVWNVVTDTCGKFLGHDHTFTRELQLRAFPRFSSRGNRSLAETQLRAFLFKLRQPLDPDPYVYFQAQYQLAWVLILQRRLSIHGAEAEQLLQECSRWAFGDPRHMMESPAPNLGASSLRLLASFQEHRGAIWQAEETLRYNCEMCTMCFGREHVATLTAIAEYEDFLLRYGKVGAEMSVRDHAGVNLEDEAF
jgi:hypothetical protein